MSISNIQSYIGSNVKLIIEGGYGIATLHKFRQIYFFKLSKGIMPIHNIVSTARCFCICCSRELTAHEPRYEFGLRSTNQMIWYFELLRHSIIRECFKINLDGPIPFLAKSPLPPLFWTMFFCHLFYCCFSKKNIFFLTKKKKTWILNSNWTPPLFRLVQQNVFLFLNIPLKYFSVHFVTGSIFLNAVISELWVQYCSHVQPFTVCTILSVQCTYYMYPLIHPDCDRADGKVWAAQRSQKLGALGRAKKRD